MDKFSRDASFCYTAKPTCPSLLSLWWDAARRLQTEGPLYSSTIINNLHDDKQLFPECTTLSFVSCLCQRCSPAWEPLLWLLYPPLSTIIHPEGGPATPSSTEALPGVPRQRSDLLPVGSSGALYPRSYDNDHTAVTTTFKTEIFFPHIFMFW